MLYVAVWACTAAAAVRVYDVYPVKGPLDGGTVLTLNVSFEADDLHIISLLFYRKDQGVLSLPVYRHRRYSQLSLNNYC